MKKAFLFLVLFTGILAVAAEVARQITTEVAHLAGL